MLTLNGCWSHTFWIGLLIAILAFFGLKGCHSIDKLPCYVQAVGEQDVAVRVGPGDHRAIRFYMAENDIYKVIGAATAEDGSDWWQIEIEDIPQAWVAQLDVVATGNCIGVKNSDAPPIIIRTEAPPNIVASPTETPSDGQVPPTTVNGTPEPPPTQGQITNTPPNPTPGPSPTPLPSLTLGP